MKKQQFCEHQSDKLVRQLPRDVTLVYNLHLGFSRENWKCMTNDYNIEKGLHNVFDCGVS